MTILENIFLILAIMYLIMAITLTVFDKVKKGKKKVRKEDIVDLD